MTDKKYTIDELKIGMKVKMSELENILDMPMVLVDSKILDNDDIEGILAYFGYSEAEYEKWFRQTPPARPITPVFFNSEELMDGVVYDE